MHYAGVILGIRQNNRLTFQHMFVLWLCVIMSADYGKFYHIAIIVHVVTCYVVQPCEAIGNLQMAAI